MNFDWIKDVAWIGTTVVALAGLFATGWTARRTGQVQLTLHERQSAESRRVLEWQEQRQAYAEFLKEFQEYFDRVTTQQQLDWAGSAKGHAYFSQDEPHLKTLWNQATEQDGVEATLENIRSRIQATYGLLTQREAWEIETRINDAANQARLIASPAVRDGIALLMEASSRDRLSHAAKIDGWQGIDEFIANVGEAKATAEHLMHEDLQMTGKTAALP